MKTWQVERMAHTALLTVTACIQHGAQVTAGEWRPLMSTLLFIGALSAFAGAASVSSRLRERLDAEGAQLPTVECAAKLPLYLLWGRGLMAAFALYISGWVALASVAWDCVYPYWRRWYRARHPATF